MQSSKYEFQSLSAMSKSATKTTDRSTASLRSTPNLQLMEEDEIDETKHVKKYLENQVVESNQEYNNS